MKIKTNWYNFLLVILIVFCLIMLIIQNINLITGKTTSGIITSNVTINNYLAISFSDNLSAGILFGEVSVLPSLNTNASHNYDGVDSVTDYYVIISNDSNTGVDLCVKADNNLVDLAGDVLGLDNETYANSTSTNGTLPDLSNEISLTTSYVKSGDNIAIGTNNYYRFWLDIPVSQPSGNYNNTIYFKGIQTGNSC